MNIPESRTRQNLRRLQKSMATALFFLMIAPQIIVQSASAATVSAGTFSDVASTNRNVTAIQFLANNHIISGYPDGTFKPDQSVSRVEFLKLALLSSQVTLDVSTPSGFKDIDESAWYAPYVRKAKKEGWIQGYSDGTFKPDQSVNKVEGLKMIAEIQGWAVTNVTTAPYKDTSATAWYAPDVAYAQAHNFLEETGSFFIPTASLSRAKTSEMLFRTLITKAAAAQNYSTDLINKVPAQLPGFTTTNGSSTTTTTTTPPPAPSPAPTPTPAPAPTNFTPVAFQTNSKGYFTNVTLTQDFPNTFYQNEIYNFHGQINSGSYDTAFAFLKDDTGQTPDQNFQNTSAAISSGSFSIPVIFRKPGNYKLGIIPGYANSTLEVEISVLPNLPSAPGTGTSTTPTNLNVQYLNQNTTFSWNNGTNNLAELVVSQGSTSKTFFTRQNDKSVDAIYNDFSDFGPGPMSFKIESASAAQTTPLKIDTPWVSSASQSFIATQHTYSEVHKDQITYNTLPETLNGPGTIAFSGKTLTDIFQQAEVIRPDGKVDTLTLQTSSPTSTFEESTTILNGGNYSFNYNAPTDGLYILEINGKDGLATLNTPVYVGIGVPLIPDFFDLVGADDADTAPTSTLINNLLYDVNHDRTKYGFNTVSADPQLNQLAQNYANEMLAQNFFGHIDPSGTSPDDRRKALGITTQVGENLARAPNVAYADNGLMRSAIHRTNILDPDWTRVGLGIAKTSDNYVLVVEEFSTTPLDAAGISTMKTNIFNQINQKRTGAGLTAMTSDATLGNVADNWSNEMVQQAFFDFVAPDGSSLSANVQKAAPNRSVHIYILESQSQQDLVNEIFSSTETASGQWKSIGLGLQADTDGVLKLTLLLSN